MRYKDKVAIVTGGTKGIGAGCVSVFVEQGGATVVFCSRNEAAGRTFETEMNAKGPGRAAFVRADVSKVDDIRSVIDTAVERFGRIDCLINNAGWHPPHQPIDAFSVGLLPVAPRSESRQLLRRMQIRVAAPPEGQGEHHQHVESRRGDGAGWCGRRMWRRRETITAFTKALAVDEAAHEVRVNSVSPGNIYTPLWQEAIDQAPDPAQCRADGDAAQPLGRMGTIEEAGFLCLYLAADATFTTGVDHIISGGAELAYGRKTRRG